MPKELTEAQKRKRVEVATELQNRARESSLFDRIVTSDEKWISFVNENRHGEWRSPGQVSPSPFQGPRMVPPWHLPT